MASEIKKAYTKGLNLSNIILVKLNDDGFVHWKNYVDTFGIEMLKNKPLDYYKKLSVGDGYVEFHFIEFIQMFGEALRLEFSKKVHEGNVFIKVPFFSMNILINENTLFDDKEVL